MSERPGASERGPSYYDVGTYVHWLKERYGVGTRLVIVPAWPRVDGRGWSTWAVSVQVWRLGTAGETAYAAQFSFGRGGAWATLPAAMYAGLLRVTDKLEAAERASAEQAAF